MTASIDDKVTFLRKPEAYTGNTAPVTAIETHMSWVFLVGDRAFKLKKPDQTPLIDLTTVAARERNCREEIRLNRRLAADIYIGVRPLLHTEENGLTLDGEAGETVDWLVEMRRMPANRMLDVRLDERSVTEGEIDRLSQVLADFYRTAEKSPLSPSDHYAHFEAEYDTCKSVLTQEDFAIDYDRCRYVLRELDTHMRQCRPLIIARVEAGRYVEGHGDLRPEHICLSEPIAIFDCLEFNRDLRLVDPFDELAFLAMECGKQGAGRVAALLVRRVAIQLDEVVPAPLFLFYTAFRAVMRARFALLHTLQDIARDRHLWEPHAERYIALADRALAARTPEGGDGQTTAEPTATPQI